MIFDSLRKPKLFSRLIHWVKSKSINRKELRVIVKRSQVTPINHDGPPTSGCELKTKKKYFLLKRKSQTQADWWSFKRQKSHNTEIEQNEENDFRSFEGEKATKNVQLKLDEKEQETRKKTCDWWCEDEAGRRGESEMGATIRQANARKTSSR